MKVAIVHDWLTGMRGGEKVLEVFCELFPDADLFTLLHIKGSVSEIIEKRNIKTSFIQKLPFVEKRYRHYLPLFPSAIEQFDLRGYDLILSCSHCVAKGVIPPPYAINISYIHTPMRYVWDMYSDYFNENRVGIFTRFVMPIFANYLRMWDVTSSSRCDHFIANSRYVAQRIKRYYNRDADVIYPPVNAERFMSSENLSDYFLIISAFAPYKRIDIAIEAFNRLGFSLKIVGTGQDERRLKGMAGENIEFLGWRNEDELVELYSRCRALIFPGEEDFGIVPVEAMASGRPVIAYGKGGALETVIPLEVSRGKGQGSPTGIFFYEQTPEALIEAVSIFEKNSDKFDSKAIRNHTLKFDKKIFKENIRDYIAEKCRSIRV